MFRNNAEILNLASAFERGQPGGFAWKHENFLAVALYYCLQFPFGDAANRMRSGLRSMQGVVGYNETLTIFWLITVRQFIEVSQSSDPVELANQLVEICDESLPLKYYSPQVLFSAAAKKEHVLPDLDRFYLYRNTAKLTLRAARIQTRKFCSVVDLISKA